MGWVNCTDSEVWTFLRALAEDCSLEPYSDGSQYVPLRSMTIASKSYRKGRKMVYFPGFRFGITSRILTELRGEDSSMWLQGASHAKDTPWPVYEKARTTNATSGLTPFASLEKCNPGC